LRFTDAQIEQATGGQPDCMLHIHDHRKNPNMATALKKPVAEENTEAQLR
jgi:hypothetical protein